MRTSFWRVMVVALILVLASCGDAFAMTRGPSLEIDPLVMERRVAPGSELIYEITIENHDQLASVTLEAEVFDIREDIRGAYALVPLGTTPYSLSRWITISPSKFTIPPGGSQEIRVSVSVPRGIAGGRYGAVGVTTAMPTSAAPGDALVASTVRFRMASFIELVVTGSMPRMEAYAEYFDVSLSRDHPELRVQVGDNALVFAAAVRNEGNVHVVANGRLTISTMDGRTVAQFPLGGGRGVIIPGATVELRSVIRAALPPGEYRARAVIDYGTRRPVVANTTFVVAEDTVVADETHGTELQKFAVLPDQVDMTLRPGSMRSAVLEVVNRGEDELVLTGQVLPLAYDAVGVLLPSEDRAGGLEWVTISPQQIRIRPGMSTRVRVTARAPRDASGSYYADIVFSSEGPGLQTESGSSLLIFVGDSDADIVRRGTVEIGAVVTEGDTLSADVWFVNEGNVHVGLSGELFLLRHYAHEEAEDAHIARAREEQVASVSLDTAENPVLPGTERLLRFMMPVELEEGEYELAVRIDYGGIEPAIARHRFNLEGGIASEEME